LKKTTEDPRFNDRSEKEGRSGNSLGLLRQLGKGKRRSSKTAPKLKKISKLGRRIRRKHGGRMRGGDQARWLHQEGYFKNGGDKTSTNEGTVI